MQDLGTKTKSSSSKQGAVATCYDTGSGELVTMDVVGYPQNLREIVRRFFFC